MVATGGGRASRLIGRDGEIAAIGRALEHGRLITITGAVGVGSTSLALAAVSAAGRVPLLVDAAGLVPGDLAAAITAARTLHHDRGPGVVVLDDLPATSEHALALVPVVEATAEPLVVTARRPTRVGGEHVIRLQPLPVPSSSATQAELAQNPAVQLYLRQAAAAGWTSSDQATVAEAARIVIELDGLPLAICMVASRSGLLRKSAPVDHATSAIEHAVGANVGLLPPDVRMIWARLGVCAGPVSIDVAIALVCERPDVVMDAIEQLVDHHLVEHVPGDVPRIRMTAVSRRAALRELGRAGELDTQRDRHAEVMLAVSVSAVSGPNMLAHPDPELLMHVRDAEVALDRLIATDRGGAALELARRLAPAWWLTGMSATTRRLVDLIVGADMATWGPDRLRLSLLVDVIEAMKVVDRMVVHRAVVRLDAALERTRTFDDPALLLDAISAVVVTTRLSGEWARGMVLADEGLALARAIGSAEHECAILAWSAMIAHQLGDDETCRTRAIEALRQAYVLDLAPPLVDAAVALHVLGQGSDEVPLPRLDDVAALARSAGLPAEELLVEIVQSGAALRNGELGRCARHAFTALDLARRIGRRDGEAVGMIVVLVLAAAMGELAEAARLDGVLRPHADLITHGMAPEHAATFQKASAAVRAALGDERFDELSREQAALGWAAGVDRALHVAERVANEDPVPQRPSKTQAAASSSSVRLTPRERQVLGLVAAGHSNPQIAQALGLTSKTVMHHTTAIYRKLGVRGRAEAAVWAARHLVIAD